MVLLKLLLATVSATTNPQQPQSATGFPPGVPSRTSCEIFDIDRAEQNSAAEQQPQMPPPTVDEIDVIRHREITSKAVSAIILLALKWFKVSREYPLLRFCEKIKSLMGT